MLNILFAVSFALLTFISCNGYPVYKFRFYNGDSGTMYACGTNGERMKCFVWDLEKDSDCFRFSDTESYSGADNTTESLSYDIHPTCTDCSCSTGQGRKGGTLGDCNFFGYGGEYWLKLECVLNKETDTCPEGYAHCSSGPCMVTFPQWFSIMVTTSLITFLF